MVGFSLLQRYFQCQKGKADASFPALGTQNFLCQSCATVKMHFISAKSIFAYNRTDPT